MNVQQIVVEYKDVLDSALQAVREIMLDGNTFGHFEVEIIEGLNTPKDFETSLRNGNTMLYLGAHHEEIDSFYHGDVPFVIVVMRDGEIWAVVNGEHASY